MYSFARCHGDWDILIKVICKQEYSILEFQRGLYKTFFNGLIRNKVEQDFSRERIINKWLILNVVDHNMVIVVCLVYILI
jgi:hypothetical protein